MTDELKTLVNDVGVNPFRTYPLNFLPHYGWIEIGEI